MPTDEDADPCGFILDYVRSFRRKVLRNLYIPRTISSKQEYFFFREYRPARCSVYKFTVTKECRRGRERFDFTPDM